MKPIPSAPGYWACEAGGIWRDRRLTEKSNGRGYYRITVSVNGVAKTRYVHRLVCEAYHGPCPDGMECRHFNGRRNDNRPINLAWADKLTNEADKLLHGTNPIGTRNPQAKITDAIVLDARRRARAGEAIADIAKGFEVNRATLADAVMGRKWRHLPGALEAFSTRRKFTPDQVREIRRRAVSELHTAIAREFGVTQSAITTIVQRKSYGHVE